MGEIADLMIEGVLDCETGKYIDGDAPGYPRTIQGERKYFSGLSDSEYGIKKYLDRWGLRREFRQIITQYTKKVGLNEDLCKEIQENFGAFVQWVRKTYLPHKFN